MQIDVPGISLLFGDWIKLEECGGKNALLLLKVFYFFMSNRMIEMIFYLLEYQDKELTHLILKKTKLVKHKTNRISVKYDRKSDGKKYWCLHPCSIHIMYKCF